MFPEFDNSAANDLSVFYAIPAFAAVLCVYQNSPKPAGQFSWYYSGSATRPQYPPSIPGRQHVPQGTSLVPQQQSLLHRAAPSP